MKEYKVGEIFRHTDGRVYRCVKGETCEGCAFRCAGNDCGGPYCDGRSDGRSVKFIAVTKPSDGMLFRAKNGRMYRLAEGSHYDHQCACDTAPSMGCAALDLAVFKTPLLDWYWAPVVEDASVEKERRETMTNGDCIRSMSNEELAEILKMECPPRVKVDHSCPYSCENCWLNWLNKPAESVKSINDYREVRVPQKKRKFNGNGDGDS